MAIDWEHSLAEVIDGKYPLERFIEGDETHGVFLTVVEGEQPRKAAIRILCLSEEGRRAALARWKRSADLSHPNLIEVYGTGETQVEGVDAVYVVTEFPDESLSEVIPERALTEDETSEFLRPTLDVLGYLHGKGFAHSSIKPSNLLAVQDRLKVSREDVRAVGTSMATGPYTAPETPTEGATPAGDLWSLGMTLVEVLTQRLPQAGAAGMRVPLIVPAPFNDIAKHCLAADPQERWNVEKVSKALDGVPLVEPELDIRPKRPMSTAKVVRGALVAVGLIVVGGVVARPWLMPDGDSAPANKTTQKQTVPSGPATLPVPEPVAKKPEVPNETATERRARLRREAKEAKAKAAKEAKDAREAKVREAKEAREAQAKKAQEAKQQQARDREAKAQEKKALDEKAKAEKKQEKPAADPPKVEAKKEEPKAGTPEKDTRPAPTEDVVQQVLPEVPAAARGTINGKFTVGIRIKANAGGDVVSAAVDSRGPSWYFADLALDAAKKWKFAPGSADAPREWIIQFQFQRAATKTSVRRATAAK